MNQKITRIIIFSALAVVILVGSFGGGIAVGMSIPVFKNVFSSSAYPVPTVSVSTSDTQTPDTEATPQTTQTLEELFRPFWQTWEIVHETYVDQPVDDTELMRGAISGMLNALKDEHTSYINPDEYQQINSQLEGDYDGIGAYVDSNSEYLTIVSPMPDSPAEKAGLKPGDKIIAVDGEDMTGIDPAIVLKKVLGPAGSKVTLTIFREDSAEPIDFEITRAKIILPSVTGKMLEQGIAYVQISNFGEKTDQDLHNILVDLMKQNPKGIIVDLRYNGGGYVSTAVNITSEFIGDGLIFIEEYGDGRRVDYKSTGKGIATDIPLVVLVNGGSASASEIFSGAVQDHERGILVGETTYGKGSVQNWQELPDGQGVIRVTIARWLTPNGRQIHKIGLTPDVVVELTQEDYDNEKDPQLDKAIEVLLEKIQ